MLATPLEPKNLRCPYCNGWIIGITELVSVLIRATVVSGFSCESCDAEWDVNGNPVKVPTEDDISRSRR